MFYPGDNLEKHRRRQPEEDFALAGVAPARTQKALSSRASLSPFFSLGRDCTEQAEDLAKLDREMEPSMFIPFAQNPPLTNFGKPHKRRLGCSLADAHLGYDLSPGTPLGTK